MKKRNTSRQEARQLKALARRVARLKELQRRIKKLVLNKQTSA
jgi:hypothetical protein